jgi:predicted ferric reductase
MNYTLRRGMFWLTAFAVLAVIPLVLARVGHVPAPRTFMVELGVALGFLALAILCLQFVFSGRLERVAPRFGMDNILQFHREIGVVAVLLALAHPVVLIAADSAFLEYFDPRANVPRGVLLSLVTVALIAIAATSLWRLSFRLTYEWWRLIHGALALFIVAVGLVHALQVGHYLEPLWKKAVLAILVGTCASALVGTRLIRPWRSARRPYRVVDVRPERDRSWSLTLEPIGHAGLRFLPGQFAWITLGPTPFTLQQHPFSFASSARSRRVTFTAKELGDFTGTWKDIERGTRAFLEGPFGSFTPDPSPGTGLFFVMGGIGVTPAMSMLRTLRDDGDGRPVVLVYGNPDWENVAFREELEEMAGTMNLKVVHVLEHPPADWAGETGFVTRDLLEKYLPHDRHTYQYFICGPDPLMNVAEVGLRDLGIPWTRVYTERFSIV